MVWGTAGRAASVHQREQQHAKQVCIEKKKQKKGLFHTLLRTYYEAGNKHVDFAQAPTNIDTVLLADSPAWPK